MNPFAVYLIVCVGIYATWLFGSIGWRAKQSFQLARRHFEAQQVVVHRDNETELVAEAQAGNVECLLTLLNHYYTHLYRVALNITGNREDAEDVLQEVSLKTCTHLGEFRGDSRFYTWLVRITVNEALMRLRVRHTATWLSLDQPLETDERSLMPREIEDWGDNPEQRYAKSELQTILDRAVEGLEPQFRTVFLLRDVEEFSMEETASMLGLSVSAVKSRLLRARLKLRQRLNTHLKKGQYIGLQRSNSEAV